MPKEPCEIVPVCPVCGKSLYLSAQIQKLKVCVCSDCGTTVSIPEEAWEHAKIARGKLRDGV
jgi:hypothetical protein